MRLKLCTVHLVGLLYFPAQSTTLSHIEFQGAPSVHPSILARENIAQVGDTYDSLQIALGLDRVMSLDLFASAQQKLQGDTLLILLRELPHLLLLPAINKTDLDGWSLGIQGAHLNLWGQDIRIEGRWSTATQPKFFQKNEGFLLLSSPWIAKWPIAYQINLTKTRALQSDGWFENSWRGEAEWLWPSNRPTSLVLKQEWISLDTNHVPGFQIPQQFASWLGVRGDYRDKKVYTQNGFVGEYSLGRWEPKPAQHWAHQINLQHWFSPIPSWTLQNGLCSRTRLGPVNDYIYYRIGGPNTLRGFVPGEIAPTKNEFLAQSELQWHLMQPKIQELPWTQSALFWGIDLVGGVEYAQTDHKNFMDLFLGFHLLLPGFERLRFEIGQSPQQPWDPKFQIGLFQKIQTQKWPRR